MGTVRFEVNAGQIHYLIDFFKDFQDEKMKCRIVEQSKIKCLVEAETELTAAEAADYAKKVFKATPNGFTLYFSIHPKK